MIQQNNERFGRDIIYGNDTQNLTFYIDATGERVEDDQIINDSGRKSFYLNNGFYFIQKTLENFGFEGEIEYILEKDGIQFTIGILDLANPDTDYLTYCGCNIIQNTSISNYKKQLDTSIDVFSTKNIRGEIISPAATIKFLRKAVPQYTRSKWNSQNSWNEVPLDVIGPRFADYYFYNVCNNIVSSDIKNTGSSSQDKYKVPGAHNESENYYDLRFDEGANFEYIKSKFALTNVEINIKNFNFTQRTTAEGGGAGYAITTLYVKWGYDINAPETSNNTAKLFDFRLNGSQNKNINQDFSLKIGFLPAGASIWVFMRTKVWQSTTVNEYPRFIALTSISKFDVTIESTSIALDTIISGVRYIDMIKQCSKFINNLPIDAQIFDVGGEYYDNICYGRSLLSPNTANELKLISNTTPEGKQVGEIIRNTDPNFLTSGLYFWNGLNWIFFVQKDARKISLISDVDPAGLSINEVIYDLVSNGLFFWNGTKWLPLQILRPFITSIKDCYETAMTIETFSDYEINQDKIYFGKYADFYQDTEIGRFLIEPSKDLKVNFNERFKINNFKLGYETYETNRLSKDTANDIHTESEWSIPNQYVENKLERSIKFIRSGYSAQAMVDIETNTPATADENDDKVYINDIFSLPAGTICQFTANLQMTIVDGRLNILNRNSSTQENDVIINWQTRGLIIGQDFTIYSGQNAQTYKVFDITNTTLTLTPPALFTPTFVGDSVIEIRYEYVNVFWQTKSNEEFEYVNNLLNSNRYPNLNFSIKRNLLRWTDYLKTANLFHTGMPIRKLFFKNNPLMVSKRSGEKEVTEIADFILDLNSPILSPKIIDLQTLATFSQVLEMMEQYNANERGFITCYDEIGDEIQGYPQMIDYTWKSGILNLKLEEKYTLSKFKIFAKTFDNTFN